MLEEAIKNARERDTRTLLRAIRNNDDWICFNSTSREDQVASYSFSKSKEPAKTEACAEGKVGELFSAPTLEGYADLSKNDQGDGDGVHDFKISN
ncbi:hypothetical protein Nepgr_006199 [Nepenthes gracilis]|uniref:Uncharacterized protein n=1 Tax=Nepenthes gracilis TaxID=150966 RepID=A0AAD3S4Q2_NEPGR|nr:hypothetical protein Nepgr_006199 [Nepenthes gracilis]